MVENKGVSVAQEQFPWIYADLESRRRGDVPRFEPPVHHCPSCGRL